MADEPAAELAARVLPAPLYRALVHVFTQGPSGVMLVGGTALAGYYAGHRRSDDLDFFVRDEAALRATVLAVESLAQLGTQLTARQRTAQFYDAVCTLDSHAFTVQAVLDRHLFVVGQAARASDGVVVAELETLLKTKAATLVSRCSEKDLYDLAWLFGRFDTLEPAALIALGAEIDGGMTPEAAMLSVAGARLREAACDFSLSETPSAVFAKVTQLRDGLARAFDALVRKQPATTLGELLRLLK